MYYSLKFQDSKNFISASGEKCVSAWASATEDFWKAWRTSKADLKAKGYSVFKDYERGWVVRLTTKLPSHQTRVEMLEVAVTKPRVVVVTNSDELPPWEGPSMFDSK